MDTEAGIFEASYQMLINIPWWVYVIFFYSISKGINMSETRIVQISKLIIFPILFFLLSIHTMKDILIYPTNLDVLHWIIAIMIGTALGWIHLSSLGIKIDKEKPKAEIPGSFIPLGIFIFLFFANYFFFYKIALNPQIVDQAWYRLGILYILGSTIGFFLGRFMCCFYALRKKPRRAHLVKKKK